MEFIGTQGLINVKGLFAAFLLFRMCASFLVLLAGWPIKWNRIFLH